MICSGVDSSRTLHSAGLSRCHAKPSPHEPHSALYQCGSMAGTGLGSLVVVKVRFLKGKGDVCAQLAENKAILVKVHHEEQEGPLAEKVEMLQMSLISADFSV